MRVLLVNDYRTAGGCEVVAQATLTLLRARGVEAELLTGDAVTRPLPRGPLAYVDDAAARRTLCRRLQAFDPDVVHLHNFYHCFSPGILAELARHRARVVMTAHDYHLGCPNAGMLHYRGGVTQRVETDPGGPLWSRRWDHRGVVHSTLKLLQHAWNYRRRDRRRVIETVLCPSAFLESVLAAHGLPTLRLHYPRPPAPLAATRPEGPMRLIFAGRVSSEKGLVEFLEMLPADGDDRLEIVGDGDALPACRAVCTRRGLEDRVTFTGRLPHDRSLERIAASHVLVLPSVWYENAPLCMTEALCAGTSLLVSDLGGMREIVHESGVGRTFTPGDPGSLAAALEALRGQHRTGSLVGASVEAYLDERSEDRYVDALLRIYESGPAVAPTP